MAETLNLLKNNHFKSKKVHIPGSKSESNRALIISALEGNNGKIYNLASARDTKTMQSLLNSSETIQNVLDAGTTMRFLTAYYAVTNQHRVLTGTPRMQQRPIKILVDALNELGCRITYQNEVGYPPHEISKFENQLTDSIQISGDVSSQYISALLMIAPILPMGLRLELTGKIGSKPYIKMTLDILSAFGIKYSWIEDIISIENQNFTPAEFTVEADWSGASYWYAFASLAKHDGILLKGLKENSIQGDRIIAEMMAGLGIKTTFNEEGAYLQKIDFNDSISIDFRDCPDLAQTISVVCAAKGIKGKFTGLESLKIKESDRISALLNELSKLNCTFLETNPKHYELIPTKILPENITVETYDDHRMAMAFAPLVSLMNVEIMVPSVVEKSYPEFWDEVAKSGVEII